MPRATLGLPGSEGVGRPERSRETATMGLCRLKTNEPFSSWFSQLPLSRAHLNFRLARPSEPAQQPARKATGLGVMSFA